MIHEILPVGALQCNCSIFGNETTREAIVVDPGIGFGKAADESIRVLKNVGSFSTLGYPLLIGASRKSFMRSVITWTEEAREWANAATAVFAIMSGVHIVRVHDVRQARVLADITDLLL